MNNIERRDFLKLMAAVPAGMAIEKLLSFLESSTSNPPLHILLLLY